MTTLKAQMVTDRDEIFLNVDEFGETADFTPKTGDAVSDIIVIPDFTTQIPNFEIEGEHLRKTCEVYISYADVAEPAKGDKITITSGVEQGDWILVELIERDNTGSAWSCIQKERKTIGHINRGES